MKYQVTFSQYSVYDVDAKDEDEAYDKAYDEFVTEMSCPVANTIYDEVDVELIEDEENDDGE